MNEDYSYRLSEILTLLCECPVSNDNPVDCALYEIRSKSIFEKETWAKNLSQAEQKGILKIHGLCSAYRRNKKNKS